MRRFALALTLLCACANPSGRTADTTPTFVASQPLGTAGATSQTSTPATPLSPATSGTVAPTALPAATAAPPAATLATIASAAPIAVPAAIAASPVLAPTTGPIPTLVATPTPTVALTQTPAPTPAPTPTGCVEEGSELRFQSAGTTVRGTIFRPQASGPSPAVLLLHTRGGLGLHELGEAASYASQGFVAYAPDYFAPIGVTPQTFDVQTFAARYTSAVVDHLVRAVECLGRLPGVERTRIGAVGYSMGGYMALVLATRPGIVAAAGWYAAYRGLPASVIPAQQDWSTVAAAVRVPVLLLHGDADTEVRVDPARQAEATLELNGKRSKLVVYTGVGHGYDQLGSSKYQYDAAATADSRARTLAFLRGGA